MMKKLLILILAIIMCSSIQLKGEQSHEAKIFNRDGKSFQQVCEYYRGVYCAGSAPPLTSSCCYTKKGSRDVCGTVSGCKLFGGKKMEISDMQWDY